jgi:hypothetical protein
MLIFITQSRWLLVTVFVLIATQAFGHSMSEAEKQSIIDGGNLRYIWIGATHMLSGYDHLAFVFGIIFFLRRFKDIVKYITAFTLGHSVTLILATFSAIQVNYFLVDAVIALSICYIAFANLKGFEKYLNIKPPNMLMMITGLGLIHGLGLSTRLQQLPLSEDHLLMNIISFNIGIEIGQILALTLMLIAITLFRRSRSFPKFSQIANCLLIFIGIILFIFQIYGYTKTSNAEGHIVSTESVKPLEENQEWKDIIVVTIPPGGDKEFSVRVAKGSAFEYTWQTNGEMMYFDFHAEPAGDITGYFESFKTGTSSQSSGSFTALFDGTHGWYWKSIYPSPVVVRLKIRGEYQLLDLNDSEVSAH